MNQKSMFERFYVAIGGHGWGKGITPEAAKFEARKRAARVRFDVWGLPRGAHSVFVDEMGTLRWSWMEGADKSAQAVQIEKAGKPVARPEDEDDGIAEWKAHVLARAEQRASAKEQGS